jgi:hypothetical protein
MGASCQPRCLISSMRGAEHVRLPPFTLEGFELLGSPVGGAAFCVALHAAHGKVSLFVGRGNLPHLQTQALLLRFCTSFCKVVHLVRTVPPHLWGGASPGLTPSLGLLWRWSRGLRQISRGPLSYLASLTEVSKMIGIVSPRSLLPQFKPGSSSCAKTGPRRSAFCRRFRAENLVGGLR